MRFKMKMLKLVFASVALGSFFFAPSAAVAHAPEQSYIYLRIYESSIDGRFEITTDDLNRALELNLRPGMSVQEVEPYLTKIRSHILENASFSTKEKQYNIRFTKTDFLRGGNLGDYLQLYFQLENVTSVPETMGVSYRFLFDTHSAHQGLLVIEYNWKAGIHANESIPSLIFTSGNTKQELPLSQSASVLLGFYAMIKMGVWHIWIGFDHILFLLALLLPSVLIFRHEDELSGVDPSLKRSPVDRFKPALLNVVKIVTFFTLAHSVTLSLASLEIVDLPSRLVESVIAISIALAALHNIWPVLKNKEWIIAFGFGLFHGFGFASVLAEKGFAGDYLVLSLLGFNIGVEVGQLAIICLVFPALFLLRKTRLYMPLLVSGSIFLVFVSLYWFVERAFLVDLPLGGLILRALNMI